jgi:hypothetical protein
MALAASPAADFLSAEIDPKHHPLFPAALRRAYATADHVIEAHPFLQTPGGKFQRGDLIACAAEYEVQRLIETGVLDLPYSWEDYERPTGKHLVVHTARGKLTISQVPEAKAPRKALFRDKYQRTNTPFLFEEMARAVEADQSKKHILLLHGYRALTFAHLALPHRLKDEPIFMTDNLVDLPYVRSASEQPEGPSHSPDPEAVDNVIKVIFDNDPNSRKR